MFKDHGSVITFNLKKKKKHCRHRFDIFLARLTSMSFFFVKNHVISHACVIHNSQMFLNPGYTKASVTTTTCSVIKNLKNVYEKSRRGVWGGAPCDIIDLRGIRFR